MLSLVFFAISETFFDRKLISFIPRCPFLSPLDQDTNNHLNDCRMRRLKKSNELVKTKLLSMEYALELMHVLSLSLSHWFFGMVMAQKKCDKVGMGLTTTVLGSGGTTNGGHGGLLCESRECCNQVICPFGNTLSSVCLFMCLWRRSFRLFVCLFISCTLCTVRLLIWVNGVVLVIIFFFSLVGVARRNLL